MKNDELNQLDCDLAETRAKYIVVLHAITLKLDDTFVLSFIGGLISITIILLQLSGVN